MVYFFVNCQEIIGNNCLLNHYEMNHYARKYNYTEITKKILRCGNFFGYPKKKLIYAANVVRFDLK